MNNMNGKDKVLKQSTKRKSSLELFRIITMMLIISHHYVVNSGLAAVDGPIFSNLLSWKSVFLLLFGAWGKIGINCFVLITGYFMCTSQITVKKFVKLIAEIMFYKLVFYVIFLISGYEKFSLITLGEAILPIIGVNQNFTGCFLIFYLTIPFINILIKNLSEKQHLYLLFILLFIYVFFGTVKILHVDMNYVSWFIVVYLIAAYIRLYSKKVFNNSNIWKKIAVFSIAIAVTSVLVCICIKYNFEKMDVYFGVMDCNTLISLLVSVSCFMLFKNYNMKYSKVINTFATSTYGVLLIHANSSTMRRWLWQDLLHNVEVYDTKYLVIHAVLSVVIIYVVCTCIDYLRIRFIEKPFFELWDKHEPTLVSKYKTLESAICRKLQIKEE